MLLLAAVVSVVCLAAAGCGSDHGALTAESKCRDYNSASPEAQTVAVNKLAQELNAPNAAGVGQPNIGNACERSPDSTLGTVVSRYRPADQRPRVSSSDDGVPDIDDTAALRLLATDARTPPRLESTGFQLDSVGPTGGGTARELITEKVANISRQANVLPDGVTLDAFSRLLDKALITQTPPDEYGGAPSCLFCHMQVMTPDEQVKDYYSWVVTFPPEGESPDQYLAKLRAEYGGSSASGPSTRSSATDAVDLVKAYVIEDDAKVGCAMFSRGYIRRGSARRQSA
jgi:hypothetical protein